MRLGKIIGALEAYERFVEEEVGATLKDPLRADAVSRQWEGATAAFSSRVKTLPTGLEIPQWALPRCDHPSAMARYLAEWGLPGSFPYGLSIYPEAFLVGDGVARHEEPTRMFAGLGDPAMTHERFLFLTRNQRSRRLSTAFDTHTLMGRDADDPEALMDVGEGGVSVSTFEDVKVLYDGFLDGETSISMTVNGPSVWMTAARLRAAAENGVPLEKVRGTSQTDPCKEDDAQNELLFPLDKSIAIAMDMFLWCQKNAPRYYPINVSGYHIEQKGATPVEQAAFTLAHGFLYIDEARKRGMDPGEAARRLPFFFTSGLDIEYTALLSAARRIWAVALRDGLGVADPAAQRLKCHIQTSGRSLYEREILNNITRTAIELFYALLNVPQSLHSNSYDEPITTPTEGAVQVAADAQSILLEEAGGFKDMMGFLGDSSGRTEIYRRVMGGILDVFREIEEAGGVMAAKATGYFRNRIAASSAKQEAQIRSGQRPVVGLNIYHEGRGSSVTVPRVEIDAGVKERHARAVAAFKAGRDQARVKSSLAKLKEVALQGGDVFAATYDMVDHITLGEWTFALQQVYGVYRRRM